MYSYVRNGLFCGSNIDGLASMLLHELAQILVWREVDRDFGVAIHAGVLFHAIISLCYTDGCYIETRVCKRERGKIMGRFMPEEITHLQS